jgi:hypothetical protein
MSVIGAQENGSRVRPRVWWRVAGAACVVAVLLAASNYFLLWLPANGPAVWIVVDIVLIGLAAVAAYTDIEVLRERRPLRSGEALAIAAVTLVVLLWAVAVILLSVVLDGASLLLLVLPVVPLVALFALGSVLGRRS